MRAAVAATTAAALAATSAAGAAPGDRIRWELVAPAPDCPPLAAVELSVVDGGTIDGRRHEWIQIDLRAETGSIVRVALLAPADAPLARDGVRRYQLFPRNGPSLEYVDAAGGRAVAPGAWIFPRLFPRDADGNLFFAGGTILDRALREVERGTGAAAWSRDVDRRLVLDEDVVVANSRWFRDDGRGRRGGDWTWVELDAADYRTLIEAGFNRFEIPLSHLPRVRDEPVRFTLAGGFRDHPELLWRSNFDGAVPFLDEPAVRALRGGDLAGARDPGDAAARIRDFTRADLDAASPGIPAWEAAASAVPYLLEAGAAGAIWESRLRPAWLARRLQARFGVSFPRDARSAIALHVAMLRGAARRFGVPWGVSVYGQMEAAAADSLFPLAYEAGATYFWLWTSDADHHVPFARQVRLARALQEHRRAHPRPEGAAARSRQARTAVVLPRGFALDEVALSLGARGRAHPMWDVDRLALSRRGAGGATYRDVGATALRAIVDRLDDGRPFDILFLGDDETAAGYERVSRVGEDAILRNTP